jgi:hypothetical protein
VGLVSWLGGATALTSRAPPGRSRADSGPERRPIAGLIAAGAQGRSRARAQGPIAGRSRADRWPIAGQSAGPIAGRSRGRSRAGRRPAEPHAYLSGELWESEALVGEGRVIHQMPVQHAELTVRHGVLRARARCQPAAASAAPHPNLPNLKHLQGLSVKSSKKEGLAWRGSQHTFPFSGTSRNSWQNRVPSFRWPRRKAVTTGVPDVSKSPQVVSRSALLPTICAVLSPGAYPPCEAFWELSCPIAQKISEAKVIQASIPLAPPE